MSIDDPAFQDFREDASCLIRPQSLIGEKFVECRVTLPRAPASPVPPPLEQIPEGEPGEGQYLLPLEQNGKAVDLDLVNDIMQEPYPDRFRLILNDLGAGLAARGDELAEIVERSNPALRETNAVLAILARQNRSLAQLSSDSDAILGALARERESVAGFINESTTTAEATAERAADLEESFARFPGFLRELRSTMTELRAFSDASTPVLGDLRTAAPSLTRVNRLLVPFSNAGTGAVTSLGKAAEAAGPPLVASDPVIRQTRSLARAGKVPTRELARFLSTHAAHERVQVRLRHDLRCRRGHQRLRQLRALPARPDPDQQLLRLHRDPAARLRRELHRLGGRGELLGRRPQAVRAHVAQARRRIGRPRHVTRATAPRAPGVRGTRAEPARPAPRGEIRLSPRSSRGSGRRNRCRRRIPETASSCPKRGRARGPTCEPPGTCSTT